MLGGRGNSERKGAGWFNIDDIILNSCRQWAAVVLALTLRELLSTACCHGGVWKVEVGVGGTKLSALDLFQTRWSGGVAAVLP